MRSMRLILMVSCPGLALLSGRQRLARRQALGHREQLFGAVLAGRFPGRGHLVGDPLQNGIERSRDAVLSSEQNDLAVQVIGLDAPLAAHQALPARSQVAHALGQRRLAAASMASLSERSLTLAREALRLQAAFPLPPDLGHVRATVTAAV